MSEFTHPEDEPRDFWELLLLAERGNISAARALIKKACDQLRQIEHHYAIGGPVSEPFDQLEPLARWLPTILERLLTTGNRSVLNNLLLPRHNGGRRPTRATDEREAEKIATFKRGAVSRIRTSTIAGQHLKAAIGEVHEAMLTQRIVHPVTKRTPTETTLRKWYFDSNRHGDVVIAVRPDRYDRKDT